MIATPKKIKVRITKKVSHYRYNGVRYNTGDIVEIEPRLFKAHFMEKVVPPPKPVVKVEPPEDEEPKDKEETPATTKKTNK